MIIAGRISRHAANATIFALFGLVTSVGITLTFSCAFEPMRAFQTPIHRSETNPLIVRLRKVSLGRTEIDAWHIREAKHAPLLEPSVLRDEVRVLAYTDIDPSDLEGCILPPSRVAKNFTDDWSVIECGWPSRSTWGSTCRVSLLSSFPDDQPFDFRTAREVVHQNGLVTLPSLRRSSSMPSEVQIPYLPLWRGLILNTLFYAAIWWGLLALPRLTRRTLRARRGLCPRCAYDLRGTPASPCPECGTASRPPRFSRDPHAPRAQ